MLSAMIATSLYQPRGFNLRMRLAPTQYEYKLLITLVVGMYWIYWPSPRARIHPSYPWYIYYLQGALISLKLHIMYNTLINYEWLHVLKQSDCHILVRHEEFMTSNQIFIVSTTFASILYFGNESILMWNKSNACGQTAHLLSHRSHIHLRAEDKSIQSDNLLVTIITSTFCELWICIAAHTSHGVSACIATHMCNVWANVTCILCILEHLSLSVSKSLCQTTNWSLHISWLNQLQQSVNYKARITLLTRFYF